MQFEIPADCPICAGTVLSDEGLVVHEDPPTVSGVPIDLGPTAYHIVACARCSFRWKHPQIPPDRLEYCYQQGQHSQNEPDPYLRQFDAIKASLLRHIRGPKILDVGCDTGALLSYIGSPYELYGVEPSPFGCAKATGRGVNILGPSFSSIDPNMSFDAIVAIDVLEHMVRPGEFVGMAARHLNPNGILLVVTGDSAAWSWRLQKSRYWYVSIPAHISFVTASVMREAGRPHHLRQVDYRRIPHDRVAAGTRLNEAFKGVAFSAARTLGAFRHRRAPWWTSANDHLIHVMQLS